MSPLLISLGAGVLIGLVYALLNVRSPAPPAVALVGLLGMIVGGQLSLQFSHKEVAAQHALSLTTGKATALAAGKKGV